MSPIGVIGLCAQDSHGDLVTACASQLMGIPTVASTLSNDPLEAVADALADSMGFFQLYTPKLKCLAESLVQRAQAAGFRAIVVTLDTWLTGWQPRDLNAANFPQLRGHALANYFSDEILLQSLKKSPEADLAAAIAQWACIFGKNLTWGDLPWLRSLTKLPLIFEGHLSLR